MAIYTDFKDFVQSIPQRGGLAAIDWGIKKSGVAITGETQEFAFPKETIVASEKFMKELLDIINSEHAVGIIIGLPVFSDGSDSETTGLIRRFAHSLAELTNLPIVFSDESLSSVAAAELFKSAAKSEQKKGLDAFAAMVILQDAISKIKRIRNVA